MKVILREALVTVLAQRLASTVTLVLVAAMCASVLLTSGKAEGSQQSVLATIDSAGTRSIVVRASPEVRLRSDVLDRFAAISGVEAAVALGSAQDVRNSQLPDGTPVPLRDYWGEGLGIVNPGEAVASRRALSVLGMNAAVGSVSNSDGADAAVIGVIEDPSFLADYEPLLLTPRAKEDIGAVGVVVIITTDATLVGPVSEVIRPMVAGNGSGDVVINTSHELASLRGTINEQLGSFGTGLAAAALLVAGALVGVVQSALVLLKRKDWGRRRALGASRRLIVLLIMSQTCMLATFGATLGTLGPLLALRASRDPLPSPSFVSAVALLALTVSVIASLVPAIVASRRDPIRELRVP